MPVDQFLFTHCTFASSFLDRRAGENSDLPKGYGPRSSSLPADRLNEVVQRVEGLFHYSLPRDTPPEDKLILHAGSAPRRLVYLPDSAGLQVAVQVCYRQEDTGGRPGSFFSHALVRETMAGQPDWTPLEVVSLWAATTHRGGEGESPFWYAEDDESLPFDLPAFESLDALRDSIASRCLDDGVLASFLQSATEDDFEDPAGLIPDRWKRRPLQQRRWLLEELVSAFVESLERDVSVLLVAEPSFAALLFYALMRSLSFPSVFPAEAFSFSTYEAEPDDVLTRLAAIPLPAGGLQVDEDLRVGHVIIDTFADERMPVDSGRREGQVGLVELLLEALDEGGWPRVDRVMDTIAHADPGSFVEVGHLVQAYRDASGLVVGERDSNDHRSWQGVSSAETLFEHAVIDRLLENADHPDSWFGSRAHAESLEILGTRESAGLAPEGQRVIQSLMDNMIRHDSVGLLLSLLQSTRLLSEYKVWLVCRVMQQDPEQPLPEMLELLWNVPAEEMTADFVFAGVVARWMIIGDFRQLDSLCRSVPDGRQSVLLSAAAHGIRGREYKSELAGDLEAWTETGQKAMSVILKPVSDEELCEFLNGPHAEKALGVWPKCDGELDQRLGSLAQSLASHPSQFSSRIRALDNASAWGRAEHGQVADWKTLSEGLLRLLWTDTTQIDPEAFVDFRRAAKRLKLFRWRESRRMKNLVRSLDKIARAVSSSSGEPPASETQVVTIEPGLIVVGIEWTSTRMNWDEFVSYDYGAQFAERFSQESQQIRRGLATGEFRYRSAWDPRGWPAAVRLACLILIAALVVGTVAWVLLVPRLGGGESSEVDSGDGLERDGVKDMETSAVEQQAGDRL